MSELILLQEADPSVKSPAKGYVGHIGVVSSSLGVGLSMAEPIQAVTSTAAELAIASGAKAVRLTVIKDATTTADVRVHVCFDPPTTAIRDIWLDEAQQGVRHVLLPGTSESFLFETALTKIAWKGYVTGTGVLGTLKLLIEGVA